MSVAHPRTPLETVIDALVARGKRPRGNDQGWTSLCPAHEDSTPSLSIGVGQDDRVLIHCHAGCHTTDILATLDLTTTDLFNGTSANGATKIEDARYPYVDELGNHLFDVIRYWTPDGKTFRQQAADGTWSTRGIRKVPYRLPELLASIADGDTVFIVEGEKDVHALDRAECTATTNPGGAGKWSPDYNQHFTDADVVIVADRDIPGRTHAQYVAAQLTPLVASLRVVEAATGKDAADHLAAGHTVEQFRLIDPAKPPPAEEKPPGRDATSWRPVDLSAALTGLDIPPPELWHRSDNTPLIYRARVHWFQGESESCKSWAAQIVVAAELNAGRDVLYIDYEDDDRGVVSRLRALGATSEAIKLHLVYIRPDEALRDRQGRHTDAWTDLVDALEDRPYNLCVIDGVTEAMTVEGLNLLDNTDIAAWMRLIPKRISTTGAAVVCIDHVVKNGENQGRYAIGGQHKLAGVTGAAYRFTALRPLARATSTDPVIGTVAVTVMKDRPGYVRGRSPEGKVGTLTITAYPDGGVTASLDPHNAGALLVDMAYAGRILQHLSLYDGLSKNRIENEVEGKVPSIRNALSWLVTQEWIRVEQKGQSHLHWLTEKGRQEVPTE